MRHKQKIFMRARKWTTVKVGLQIRLKNAKNDQKTVHKWSKIFFKAFNIYPS